MNDLGTNVSRLRRAGAVDEIPAPSRGTLPIAIRYWQILYRRKWVVVGVTLAALLAGIVLTLLATPRYQAAAIVEISRDDVRVVNIEGVEPHSNALDQEFYETQYGLLKSRSLAERVARDLNLADDPHFFATYKVKLHGVIALTPGRPLTSAGREARLETAVNILRGNLDIKPARLSRLAEIRFTSPDNLFAARVANRWAELFIASNLERRFEAASYARQFLQQRLEDTRHRLDESELRLVSYATRQNIITLTDEGTDPRLRNERSLIAENLTRFNAELNSAVADRVRAQGQYDETRSAGAITQGLGNVTLANLRQRRAEVAAEYAKLLAQFQPTFPAVEAAKSELDQLDKSIAEEQKRVNSGVAADYRQAVDREGQLHTKVSGLESALLDLRRRSIQYNIYQRDVDTNRALYDGLLQRYKEIGIAGGVGTNNISIVDRALPPGAPASPRPFVNMFLALMSGLILGIIVAALLEQIDEGVADPDEVERLLGVPCLGTSPLVEGEVLTDLSDRKSDISEAYASIRTNLGFSTPDGIPRTLMITSTRATEGKTTTAYALGLSLARLGRKVLLVDADMRSPSLHRLLGLGNTVGLSNALVGDAELHAVVQELEELTVLTSGPRPPSAAELLSSSRLPLLLAEASRLYDNVIIDSPPILGLADAPLIAAHAAGTAFVIQSRNTRARFARAALDRLEGADAHVLGVVLTKFDVRNSPYGYRYDYGYGYGKARSS